MSYAGYTAPQTSCSFCSTSDTKLLMRVSPFCYADYLGFQDMILMEAFLLVKDKDSLEYDQNCFETLYTRRSQGHLA